MAYLPIKLTHEQVLIYKQIFKNILKKSEFKFLMSFAKEKHVVMVNSNIIIENNPFEELILIDYIPQDKHLYMMTKDIKFMELVKGQWIGSLETIDFMKAYWIGGWNAEEMQKMNKSNRWGVSVWVEGQENDEEAITYYKWEKEDLWNIFMDKKHGKKIMNALYSVWLPQIIFYHQSAQKMGAELEADEDDPNFDSKFLDSHADRPERRQSRTYKD